MGDQTNESRITVPLRELEPQRPGESELNAYYRHYDAAVAMLPRDIARQCDFRRGGRLGSKLVLDSAYGKRLATVDLETGVVTIGEPVPTPAPAKEPVVRYARKETILHALKIAGRYVRAQVSAAEEKLAGRIAELEERLSATEDQGFRFRGFWRDGHKAVRGDAFSHDGSIYWAVRTTADRPGPESPDWKIAVKRGRDAR